MLNDLDLGIGISQTMMFMRANGLKKMFLDEYDNTGSLRKVGTCWKAPSKSKKSFVFMPWAYRAYIMTKEVVYLAGYDVDLTNDEGMAGPSWTSQMPRAWPAQATSHPCRCAGSMA